MTNGAAIDRVAREIMHRPYCSLCSITHLDFAKNRFDMHLDGRFSDFHVASDRFIGAAFDQKLQNPRLLRG